MTYTHQAQYYEIDQMGIQSVEDPLVFLFRSCYNNRENKWGYD